MDDQYSSYTALLYVFNLIVGTGALTLPKAFSEAGWLLSTILLVVMAFMSYLAATFVVESISRCHSIQQFERVERMMSISREVQSAILPDADDDVIDSTEDSLMLPAEFIDNFPSQPQKMFSLDVRVEFNAMAATVFSPFVQYICHICLCLYLYGDLTIYAAAVSKSLVDTFCTNVTMDNATMTTICWEGYNFSVGGLYRIYLGSFLLLFGPFVFFNVQKTKLLQMMTAISRWIVFSTMIGLAIWRLTSSSFVHGTPQLMTLSGTPALVGSTVYSFMCHHSLPSLIAPIQNKRNLLHHLAWDYAFILIVYLTLGLTAVFAFPVIEDLYTLNFAPEVSMSPNLLIVSYILALFPVYTLTTSFPIIAVTLRGNLQATMNRFQWRILHTVCLPILAVVPPVIIAMTTLNIEELICITGTTAGVAVQYFIPATLVIYSRKQTPARLLLTPNPYSSPFKSNFWPGLVLVWGVICYSFNAYNIKDTFQFQFV